MFLFERYLTTNNEKLDTRRNIKSIFMEVRIYQLENSQKSQEQVIIEV